MNLVADFYSNQNNATVWENRTINTKFEELTLNFLGKL